MKITWHPSAVRYLSAVDRALVEGGDPAKKPPANTALSFDDDGYVRLVHAGGAKIVGEWTGKGEKSRTRELDAPPAALPGHEAAELDAKAKRRKKIASKAKRKR